MRIGIRSTVYLTLLLSVFALIPSVESVAQQQPTFRNAPASATQMKNPYAGSAAAAAEGKKLYAQYCAQCHGREGQGMGPAPAVDAPNVRKANAGELFWFISTGKLTSGMPGWSNLAKPQRWQLVTFLQSNLEKAAK